MIAVAGCHHDGYLTYAWDDRRVLCSQSVDDLTTEVRWKDIDETFAYAERERAVALVHAHVPGASISAGALDRVLALAEDHHLELVGYDELGADLPARGALAFAFDDQATEEWTGIRDVLSGHGARVTFFITRFPNYTDEMKAQLAVLAADGHDIEAHSITHPLAEDYLPSHTIDDYLRDEVLPSFEVLRAAGYTPTSYAFPFGHAPPELQEAVLALPDVARVRMSPKECPN